MESPDGGRRHHRHRPDPGSAKHLQPQQKQAYHKQSHQQDGGPLWDMGR